MFDQLIVAFSDKAKRDAWAEIADLLAVDWNGAAVTPCSNVAVARKALLGAGSRHLVVIGRDLPERTGEPTAVGGAEPAKAFLEELQARATPPACVLVGPANNRINVELAGLKLAGTLFEGTANEADMIADLRQLATSLAAKRDQGQVVSVPPTIAGLPPTRSWALLEVHLDGTRSRCGLRIGRGTRIDALPEIPLELDISLLSQIMTGSRDLRKKMNEARARPESWDSFVKRWQGDYERLGRTIYDLIGRTKFQMFWGMAREAANENVRLRFVLNEDMYDGLWESMFDSDLQQWMMLQSTITRQARTFATSHMHRLDGGDGVVHVLAVGSNVPDGSTGRGPPDQGWKTFWDDFHTPLAENFFRAKKRGPQLNEVFPPLPEIQAEMSVLRDLKDKVNEKRPGKIDLEVLDGPVDGKSLYERVKKYLSDGEREGGAARCDVVHFAGHALFNEVGVSHDRGYLVFGGNPYTDFVPVSTFARMLKEAGVQMVYLSCCRSSAARAAFELARAGIPLAIGFTWDLDSTLAVEFAEAFYSALLRDLKVCRAFQSAREALQAQHQSGDPIWASPVLVAQPEEWRSVEGYMTAAG